MDLAILGPVPNPSGKLSVGDAVCSGIYALAQKVIILMLTDMNAPASFGFGTNLFNDIYAANIVDAGVIKGNYDIAAQRVTDNLRLTTPATAPLDEQLDHIEVAVPLEQMQGDSVGVVITVYSKAGTSFKVTAPKPYLQVQQ